MEEYDIIDMMEKGLKSLGKMIESLREKNEMLSEDNCSLEDERGMLINAIKSMLGIIKIEELKEDPSKVERLRYYEPLCGIKKNNTEMGFYTIGTECYILVKENENKKVYKI